MHQLAIPHELIWTDERVSRFWGYVSSNPVLEREYFGYQAGKAVIEFARHYVRFKGRIIDFGCGPGMFMEHLFAQGIACEGLDFSADSLEIVNRKFGENPLFRGTILVHHLPLPIESATVDTVFFLETIEHLLPEQLNPTLAELWRILKPTGRLVLTTPHNEDLSKSSVYCAECGSVFHRWQHLRSFTTESIEKLMAAHRYERVTSQATLFENSRFTRTLLILAARIRNRQLPNLIYIGKKSAT